MKNAQQWWFHYYVTKNLAGLWASLVFSDSYLIQDVEVRKIIAGSFLKKYHKKNPMGNPFICWWMKQEWVGLHRLHQKNKGQGPCPFLGTHVYYDIVDEDLLVVEQVLIQENFHSFYDKNYMKVIVFSIFSTVFCGIGATGFLLVGNDVAAVVSAWWIWVLFSAVISYEQRLKKCLKENEEMASFLLNLTESTKSPLWWLTQGIEENS